jgi:hypothetical protein
VDEENWAEMPIEDWNLKRQWPMAMVVVLEVEGRGMNWSRQMGRNAEDEEEEQIENAELNLK